MGIILFIPATAHAQFTWTGAGGDDSTTNAANWAGGVAPVGDGTEDLFFGDSSRSQPNLPPDFSVRNVTITARRTGYFWGDNNVSPTNLTLTGDVTSTVGSGPFFVFNQNTLTLSAGTHMFTAGGSETGADLYVFGSLAGSGNLVKTGPRSFIVSSPDGITTFTGNIDLQQGDLNVAGDRSLGTGTIRMDGGSLNIAQYDTDHTVRLDNNLQFTSATARFGGAFNNPSLLTITGSAVASPGVTAVAVSVDDQTLLTITGGVGESTAGTNYAFSGNGTVILTGPNTYTGTTLVAPGTTLIFGSAVPATPGGLQVNGDGYLGTELTANVQARFITRFNQSATDGIIGFDSPIVSSPQTFSGAIDLSGFDPAARMGTATSAILSGPLNPQGSDYLFGGRGVLTVSSNLGDVRGTSEVQAHDGVQLYLTGNNAYTGDTDAVSGAIIFAGPNSLPTLADIYADNTGYIGQTETAGLTASVYLGHFYTPQTFGVVGFDAANPVAGRVITEDIDFSLFDQNAFLGTSTNVTFGPSILITPYADTYRFTGFRDGRLTVDAVLRDLDLSTPRNVVIGLPYGNISSIAPPGATFRPSVTLAGNNTYSGGTSLNSGLLVVGQSNGVIGTNPTTALGTGTVTVSYFGAQPTGLSVAADGILIPNVIDFADNSGFTLGGVHDFTLTGNLLASLGSGFVNKVDDNTVTLAGDNSGLDVGFEIDRGQLIFARDTAAGIATLNLRNNDSGGGTAVFTSAAPSMGSLQGEGSTRVVVSTAGNLTINQSNDATYDGVISGTGGLIKSGSASLTLTNTNTYGGATTINAGVLGANNNSAFSSGSVILNGGTLNVGSGVTLGNPVSFGAGGGVLSGNGTFSAPVTIGTNAVLSPGDSPGALTFTGGLTWAQRGTYLFQVQSAAGSRGVGFDTINVTGGLVFTATLANPFTLRLVSLDGSGAPGSVADFNNSQGYAWLIAQSDTLSGFNPNDVTIDTSGFTNGLGSGGFNVGVVGNDIFLNFSPVPEPSTYALLGIGLVGLGCGCRRRRTR